MADGNPNVLPALAGCIWVEFGWHRISEGYWVVTDKKNSVKEGLKEGWIISGCI